MIYQNSPTVNVVDYLPPLSSFADLAKYRLLQPHYFATGYFAAGTVVTAGFEVPGTWVPTLAVDPLNASAAAAFYAAGPRALSYEDLNQWARGNPQDQFGGTSSAVIPRPVTFWKQTGNFYSLTGLGANFPPVGMV